MTDVVIVHSSSKQGAQLLLDCVCRSGDLVPVMEVRPMLGRQDRWEAKAAPADQPRPARRPASGSVEFRLRRRGHR